MAPTSRPHPHSTATSAAPRTPRLIERGPALTPSTTHRLLDQLRQEQQAWAEQKRAEQTTPPGAHTVWLSPDPGSAAARGDVY